MTPGEVQIIKGNALDLPFDDATVDLVVTSPPYFGLRSYSDNGEHYDGQIGSEVTSAEYLDALIAATAEMVRVLKPSGSIWVNLGDKYGRGSRTTVSGTSSKSGYASPEQVPPTGFDKSLLGLPWRYALRCIDELGLILRAEVIWHKRNGLPESVTDRVRRSHETWFHFTVEPRYFSAVDEIREPHQESSLRRAMPHRANALAHEDSHELDMTQACHPLGRLPGSVWSIPTQPLVVPPELGIDHFAAFPVAWPRRIIKGWSPTGICTSCGEGRRPVAVTEIDPTKPPARRNTYPPNVTRTGQGSNGNGSALWGQWTQRVITGYACACPEPSAPTTPAVVLDPFGGTGTTALVAKVLGRTGISLDMSADYCRLAEWRTNDPVQLAMAAEQPRPVITKPIDGQMAIF